MAFRISFFKTPPHKVFHYTPLYWDPAKEAREERLQKASHPLTRGCFQEIRQRNRKQQGFGTIGRIIILVTLAALLVVVIYFSNFIGLILQKAAI